MEREREREGREGRQREKEKEEEGRGRWRERERGREREGREGEREREGGIILINTISKYAYLLTCNYSVLCLSDGRQVAEEVARVERLARAREAHEDEGLVATGYHHVTVGLLTSCKDVRRHVLSPAPSEHVYHLNTHTHTHTQHTHTHRERERERERERGV